MVKLLRVSIFSSDKKESYNAELTFCVPRDWLCVVCVCGVCVLGATYIVMLFQNDFSASGVGHRLKKCPREEGKSSLEARDKVGWP